MLHWLPWLLETWRDNLGIPKQCSFEWICCCIDQHQEVMLSFRLCEVSLIQNPKRGKKNHTNFGIKQLRGNVYQSLYYNLYKLHRLESVFKCKCVSWGSKNPMLVFYIWCCVPLPPAPRAEVPNGYLGACLDGHRSVGFPCILLLGSWLHHTLGMQIKSSGTR